MRITKTDLLIKLSDIKLNRDILRDNYNKLLVDLENESNDIKELSSRIRRLEKVIQLLSNHIVKDNV